MITIAPNEIITYLSMIWGIITAIIDFILETVWRLTA